MSRIVSVEADWQLPSAHRRLALPGETTGPTSGSAQLARRWLTVIQALAFCRPAVRLRNQITNLETRTLCLPGAVWPDRSVPIRLPCHFGPRHRPIQCHGLEHGARGFQPVMASSGSDDRVRRSATSEGGSNPWLDEWIASLALAMTTRGEPPAYAAFACTLLQNSARRSASRNVAGPASGDATSASSVLSIGAKPSLAVSTR